MPTNTAITLAAYGLLIATVVCLLSQVKTLIAISEVVDTIFMASLFVLCVVLLYRRSKAPPPSDPS